MLRKAPQSSLSAALLLCCLGLFIYSLVCLLPLKGFDFTDIAYYLYNSHLLSHGIVPRTGFATAPNAFFMLFGIRRYLFFEYLAAIFIAVSIVAFWSSLLTCRRSLFVGLIVLIGFYSTSTTIISYSSYSVCYLLLGLGCFFYANRATNLTWKKCLYILSGLLLALAAMSNTALFPTLVSSWILIYLFARKQTKLTYFHSAYWFTGLSLLVLYFYSPLNIFVQQAFYGLTYGEMLTDRLPRLLTYLTPGGHCFALLAITFLALANHLFFRKKKFFRWLAIAFLMAALIFAYQKMPSLVALPKIASPRLQHLLFDYTNGFFGLSAAGLVVFYQTNRCYFRLLLLFLLTTSYVFLLAITTVSGPYTHVAHMGLAFFVLFGLLVENFYSENRGGVSKLVYGLGFILLLASLVYGFLNYLYFNYRSYPVFSKKIAVKVAPLKGIYANPNKVASLLAVEQFYDRYHCQARHFLAYPAMPLFFYLFERRAPDDHAWVNPNLITASQLANVLKQHQHWCVIFSPRYDHNAKYKALGLVIAKHAHLVYRVSLPKPSQQVGQSAYPYRYWFYVS